MKMYKTVELSQYSVVHERNIYEKFSVVSEKTMLRFWDSTGTKQQKNDGTNDFILLFSKNLLVQIHY